MGLILILFNYILFAWLDIENTKGVIWYAAALQCMPHKLSTGLFSPDCMAALGCCGAMLSGAEIPARALRVFTLFSKLWKLAVFPKSLLLSLTVDTEPPSNSSLENSGGGRFGVFGWLVLFFNFCYSVSREHSLYAILRFSKNLIKYILTSLTIYAFVGSSDSFCLCVTISCSTGALP